MRLAQILTRPQINLLEMIPCVDKLDDICDLCSAFGREIIEEAEILVKYEGYIEKKERWLINLTDSRMLN